MVGVDLTNTMLAVVRLSSALPYDALCYGDMAVCQQRSSTSSS